MALQDDQTILYLQRSEVERVAQQLDSVAIIRETFALHGSGQTILPDEAYMGWRNEQGEEVRNLNMPAYVGGAIQMAGTKIINANPANPARGFPRASGLTLLYDTLTTRVLCIMESAYISSLRTASVSALSVDLLTGREIECMAIIGAGVLAQAHIELLAKRLPALRKINLFDLDRERANSLQQQVASVLEGRRLEFHLATSAEDAIRPAQLIIPATTTTTGYIAFGWLQPGAILVNISLDDPLPEVVFQANKVVVDDWFLVKNDPRRLIGRMYRAGQILGPEDEGQAVAGVRRRIDAQLGDLVLGNRPGRSHPDEVILVNPFGLAIEDIAIAAHVYKAARELGIGRQLDR